MITNTGEKMIQNKVLVKELNPCLTCSLCQGYFIDATSLVDCLHVFCRACILRYFENFKLACPTCNVVYKKKSNPCFRSDPVTQALVYKLVPGLYSREVQRREDFYRSTGVRASSSCSEDSVLGDLNEEHDDWVLSSCGDQNQYFSPDDVISLSLEYYKPYLDKTQNVNKSTNNASDKNNSEEQTNKCDDDNNKISDGDKLESDAGIKDDVKVEGGDSFCNKKDCDRRYLRCPAAVTMSHLQKFLRMKYALSVEHRVDIIYLGEVLAAHFSLMDVAYTFKWKRIKPMRFFFRIFTPAKIQPIKIINTSSMGGKQLQVVLSKTSTLNFPNQQNVDTKPSVDLLNSELDDQNYRNKERLMANLQLQSKAKLLEQNNVKNHKASHSNEQNGTSEKSYRLERLKPVKLIGDLPEDGNCVYEYEEPDKDEIRAFAEKRDREWALQKQLDEEKEKHRNGKKRKKSKHSKNNLLYKKRKLHAEITSNDSLEKEESLKLKVKITPHNGYKHKHHKSSQSHNNVDNQTKSELSSKEKLLQMRQVRHKNISGDDKSKSSQQNNNSPSPSHVAEEKVKEEPIKVVKQDKKEAKLSVEPPPKPIEVVAPLKSPAIKPHINREPSPSKTLRSDFSNKTSAAKEVPKNPRVQIERNEQTERQTQKTFLKTFQSYTENYSRETPTLSFKTRPVAPNTYSGRNHLQTTRALEQKIATLQQQCTTVEAKPSDAKVGKKPTISGEKPHILNSQYSATGFTVSKVEIGVKRKLESDQQLQDKFPSLEITLINPQVEKPPEVRPVAKRPPPATIPLEKIKKSMNRVSGVSIIPKVVDKCDNNGALDLTKPNRVPDGSKTSEVQNHILNGKSFLTSKLLGESKPPDKNILSNLQMLSKVATEHPNINKNCSVTTATTATTTTSAPKRPQMPSLQTLKVPLPQPSNKSNLAKLPKLNEINKTQFRLPNPQLKNMRPNQNQSIRNIPNPSLLVRQQNQNRLNSMNSSNNNATQNNNSSEDSKEQKVGESGEKSENVGEKK